MSAVDRGVVGVKPGVAFQGLGDRLADGAHVGYGAVDTDVVVDIDDARDVARDEFGFGALVSALRGPGEGHDSVFGRGVDGGRKLGIKHECLQHVPAQLGVLPAMAG